MIQRPRDIDTMIQTLEESIKKAQTQEMRFNQEYQTGIPLPIKEFLHSTLIKFGIPGLNIEGIINRASQFSMKVVGRIKIEFQEDPKKLLVKAGVGILVLGIVIKTIRNISTLREKRRHE